MDPKPAHEIPAGSFVAASVAGRRTLCLKAERVGKEYINHFLVPLDPLDDRADLALVYIDPNEELAPVEGIGFTLADGPEMVAPQVGDMFVVPAGSLLKVKDDPRSQKMFAYVDIATGAVRPRMEREIRRLLDWSLARV